MSSGESTDRDTAAPGKKRELVRQGYKWPPSADKEYIELHAFGLRAKRILCPVQGRPDKYVGRGPGGDLKKAPRPSPANSRSPSRRTLCGALGFTEGGARDRPGADARASTWALADDCDVNHLSKAGPPCPIIEEKKCTKVGGFSLQRRSDRMLPVSREERRGARDHAPDDNTPDDWAAK